MIRRVARAVRRAVGWPMPPDYRALRFDAPGDGEGYELGRSL